MDDGLYKNRANQSPKRKATKMNEEINLKLLAPFPATEIEWRMAQNGYKTNGEPWGKVLAYVTNRAIMKRLDDTFGPFGWRNEYQWQQINHSEKVLTVCLCGISVNTTSVGWVTKWDGAEPTDIETGKGALSDAMKRAAVQWGIGRYLYQLEEGWAVFAEHGDHTCKMKDGAWKRWNEPELPAWALPDGSGVADPAPRQDPPQYDKYKADPPKRSAPKKSQPATPTPPPTSSGTGSWREVVMRFGKLKGVALGDFELKDLKWWADNYEPRPFRGSIQQADLDLKSALCEGRDSIHGDQVPTNRAPSDKQLENLNEGPDEEVLF